MRLSTTIDKSFTSLAMLSAPFKNPLDAARLRLLKRLASLQHLATKLNHIKRIADLMGKNAKENVAVVFGRVGKTSDYLSDSLIDGFAKSSNVRKDHIAITRLALHPQK